MTNDPNASFFSIAREPSVVRRAVQIASIVGVVLAVINHGDRLASGNFDRVTILKIGLTFLVPYCVSTYSSVLAIRERLQSVSPMK